ncbi:unnamed protein product [Phytophthora fragariaefolia]|uniref:Unnamed protein product n=1 Tax=Phytophthora fragariaefolia TaxID=1490495 RepID=A0A9W6XPX7_9STRA|nr:unnamed protein product [Phytophthora fragariaefolia]
MSSALGLVKGRYPNAIGWHSHSRVLLCLVSMGAKEAEPAPEGTRPMMISMREMETLGLKTGSGLRETVEFKVFTRQQVLDQIAQVGFMCPFHEFRAEIAKMPAGDDILIVADPSETYGENWLLCLTRRAFDVQMELIKRREQDRLEALAAQEKEANAAADANDMSKIVYEDKPVLSRPWSSATARESHEDVEALSIKPSRPLITMSVTKMSDELNADYKFSDRDADQCTFAASLCAVTGTSYRSRVGVALCRFCRVETAQGSELRAHKTRAGRGAARYATAG